MFVESSNNKKVLAVAANFRFKNGAEEDVIKFLW